MAMSIPGYFVSASVWIPCSTSRDPANCATTQTRPKPQLTPAQAHAGVLKPQDRRRCECYDLYNQLVPYTDAWRWQKSIVANYTGTVSAASCNEGLDTLIMLQHPPVYTMGTRSSSEFLRFDKEHPPYELHVTERGGEVTYHGPGQLVMYPILNLRGYEMDLHWYLRSLEEVVIRALWSAYSLEGSRIDGFTGVWVGEEKVAAIGVRVSKWITYHGLALNVTTDLAPFRNIVPCGIGDKAVGSVAELLKSQAHQNDTSNMLNFVHRCLLKAFSEVFNLELVAPKAECPIKLLESEQTSCSFV